MKCVVAIAIFGLIAVASAAPQYQNQQYPNQQGVQGQQGFQGQQGVQGHHFTSSSSASSSSSNTSGNGPFVYQQTQTQHSSINIPSPSVNDRFGSDETQPKPQTFSSGYQSTVTGQYVNGAFVYQKDEKKY